MKGKKKYSERRDIIQTTTTTPPPSQPLSSPPVEFFGEGGRGSKPDREPKIGTGNERGLGMGIRASVVVFFSPEILLDMTTGPALREWSRGFWRRFLPGSRASAGQVWQPPRRSGERHHLINSAFVDSESSRP